MAVFELTGFTANAEVLGSPRQVHYSDGVLEVRGISLGEAKTAIDRLAYQSMGAVSLDTLSHPPPLAPVPPAPVSALGTTVAVPPAPADPKPAPRLAVVPPPAPAVAAPPPLPTQAAPVVAPAQIAPPPPAAPPAAPEAPAAPAPPVAASAPPPPPAGKPTYSFDEACKAAAAWTGMKQPIEYLYARGVTEYLAIEAEILKMREVGALRFFQGPSDNPSERIKRTWDLLEMQQ